MSPPLRSSQLHRVVTNPGAGLASSTFLLLSCVPLLTHPPPLHLAWTRHDQRLLHTRLELTVYPRTPISRRGLLHYRSQLSAALSTRRTLRFGLIRYNGTQSTSRPSTVRAPRHPSHTISPCAPNFCPRHVDFRPCSSILLSPPWSSSVSSLYYARKIEAPS